MNKKKHLVFSYADLIARRTWKLETRSYYAVTALFIGFYPDVFPSYKFCDRIKRNYTEGGPPLGHATV